LVTFFTRKYFIFVIAAVLFTIELLNETAAAGDEEAAAAAAAEEVVGWLLLLLFDVLNTRFSHVSHHIQLSDNM